MTPLVIVLVIIVVLETYVLIKTDKIDVFNLAKKMDYINKQQSEYNQSFMKVIDSFKNCNKVKDKSIVTIVDSYLDLSQKLVDKNRSLIKILEPFKDKTEVKKYVAALEEENQIYLDTINSIGDTLKELKEGVESSETQNENK